MAIYHLSTKPVSRGAGRSATAAAAYRSAERVHDLTTDQVFDYSRKHGVEHSEIVLPTLAAKHDIHWARDRQALWNAAEAAEKRRDARVAREYEVALPHELSRGERVELVRAFAGEIANRYGVAVDFSVHRPDRAGDHRNFHAHILTTTRVVEPTGLGAKASIEWSDTDRFKRGLEGARHEVKAVRAKWAELTNEHLLARGLEARIDHRSLEAQGIERTPTNHLGVAVWSLERRGIQTEVGLRVRAQQRLEVQQRLERAAELGRLERDGHELSRSVLDLSADLSLALRERQRGLEHAPEASAGPSGQDPRPAARERPTLDMEAVKARGRAALDRWGERLQERAAQAKQRELEQRSRERVVRDFRELAMRREMRAFGYQDRNVGWRETPADLRDHIDRYNALPENARVAVLERLVQEPAKVRTLERWLDERQQRVRELDRGLER